MKQFGGKKQLNISLPRQWRSVYGCRERAFINAAKTEAMNQTVRPAGNSVRP